MKNLFRKSVLMTLGVLISQFVLSQENYIPGNLISLNGDTLKGFIDYRNWKANPDKILFKEKLESESRSEIKPLAIKGFTVIDEVYESAIVKTEMSLEGLNKLSYESELKIIIDTTFLQAMVRGVKSLYLYVNTSGRDQFYIKRNSEFELLIYKKYLSEQPSAGGLNKAVGGKDVVILTNKRYLGQVSSYLQDCPSIQSKLKNTQYAKKSLERLFLSYYACTNSRIEFQKRTEKVIKEFGILGGASLTSIKFDGSGFKYILETVYKPSFNFSGGLFLDLVLPRNNHKWSIYNELILSAYKVNGEFNDYVSPDQYTITYTTIEYSYLKLNNMVRFKYPFRNFSPFINIGLANGYAIADKNYKREESKLFALETTKTGKAIDETKKHELGYIAGLGAKLKNYSVEVRFERGNGISNYTSLGSPTNRCYLLFGYRF